jgi:pimeloyl-ACP methyl ester carboxylesterase
MEFSDINYRGATIKVGIKGDLKKNPLVFLHGNSLNTFTFEEQYTQLDLPMITIDLPGHGLSSPAKDPEQVYSIPGYAEAVTFALSQLGPGKFILVGHSLGGHIAINAAPRLKNLKGLLIFGTPPLDSVASLGSAFLPNPLFPFLLQSSLTEEEALQLAGGMLCQEERKDELKNHILATDPSARSCFGAFVAKGVIENEVEIIKKRDFPVAILHGEKDAFVNKEYIDGLGLPNLWKNKVHLISHSGHSPQIEQAAAFNTALTDYYHSIFT